MILFYELIGMCVVIDVLRLGCGHSGSRTCLHLYLETRLWIQKHR